MPTPDGVAQKLETDDYLAYAVMAELTSVEGWRKWKTEMVSIDGEIKKDETVARTSRRAYSGNE